MVIYITTNLINGKKYLGKDSKNREHYLGSGKYLKMSIKKYGRENFKKEVIEHCKNLEELNRREVYWLKKLKCKTDMRYYNVIDTYTPCRQGKPLTEEHRQKISESRKGYKYSNEHCEKMSKILKEAKARLDCSHSDETKGKIASALQGKPKSISHRQSMSRARRGAVQEHLRKPVERLCKDTRKILKQYSMIQEVKEDGFNPHAVQNVLSGKAKTSGGFCWRYVK